MVAMGSKLSLGTKAEWQAVRDVDERIFPIAIRQHPR